MKIIGRYKDGMEGLRYHGFEVEERFGEGVGVREEIGREWEEEGRSEGWEYDYEEPGEIHQEYQPDT